MEFQTVQMNNGSLFKGKKIGELATYIIDKFSQEGLSYDEAVIVLEDTKEVLGEFCKIQSLERRR